MALRATEKIMEALSQLLEGFSELQDSIDDADVVEVEEEETEEAEEDEEGAVDPDAAIVRQMKTAIEGAMETDDYTPEEIANLIAALTEALEEVDPNIFQDADETEEEEDEEYDDEDDDLDFDDDDLDDEDEDEEEEDDE